MSVAVLALFAAGLMMISAAGASAGTGGLSAGAQEGGTGPDSKQKSSTRGERKYERIYKRKISRKNKRWAKRTAACESGGNPKAIGGGGKYRGAFQFLKTTWRNVPRSPGGDPIAYGYKTQAVVAVTLKTRSGPHHWPNCG
ncbi:MAG: transglycosylase family protein [Solirubrobacterales bacterium]